MNNAGITRDRVVWKLSDENWADVVEADLTACFRYVRAAIPRMRERGRGRIVSISSVNAARGKFGQSNYTAAKAGIIGFSKTVAREVAQYGITVNVITPGLIATELVASAPEEVRTRARHITGAVIPVDGGQNLWEDICGSSIGSRPST